MTNKTNICLDTNKIKHMSLPSSRGHLSLRLLPPPDSPAASVVAFWGNKFRAPKTTDCSWPKLVNYLYPVEVEFDCVSMLVLILPPVLLCLQQRQKSYPRFQLLNLQPPTTHHQKRSAGHWPTINPTSMTWTVTIDINSITEMFTSSPCSIWRVSNNRNTWHRLQWWACYTLKIRIFTVSNLFNQDNLQTLSVLPIYLRNWIVVLAQL